jgi:hypothetical protein
MAEQAGAGSTRPRAKPQAAARPWDRHLPVGTGQREA